MVRGDEYYMEQYILMLFGPIALLLVGIGILETNYMFGIDNAVDKFNKKYDVNIDKTTYCRFEGVERVKTATGLLILYVVYFLFEIKDLNTMIIMICIYGIIDVTLYYIKRKKFISILKSQY